MKYFLALILLFLILTPLGAAPMFRVDLRGFAPEGKLELTPLQAKGDTLKTVQSNWAREELRSQMLYAVGPVLNLDQWVTEQFSFTANGSGKVQIQFGGQWAAAETDREWVLVADIKVDGTAVPNGDFTKTMVNNGKTMPVYFYFNGTAELISGAGPDGGNTAKVNHDNRLSYSLVVEAGKSYTVSVKIKPAPAK